MELEELQEQERMRPQRGSIEASDSFSVAPPGYGLTSDNTRWAWGKPPRIVDPQQALDKAVNSMEAPKIKREMMKLLVVGASVESLVEGYIYQQFTQGEFTPDVGLLIKAPLAMHIAALAEQEDIPYRFFENKDAMDENTMDDETFFSMMRDNNPAMFEYVSETINEGIRRGNAPEKVQDNFIGMKSGE